MYVSTVRRFLCKLCSVRRLDPLRRMSVASQATQVEEPSRPKEVQIAVPWGHIAGKAWGDPSGKHVLALHGWLDNAGSFDRLIPLLSKDLHVVAVDWPGHGRSSHRPKGCWYHSYDNISDIKHIVDGMKWDSFFLLAHSMGTGAASWFAAALPERVEALVLIEGLGFWSDTIDTLPKRMGHALNTFSAIEENNRTYPTQEAAVERLLEAHASKDKTFNREAASALAVRGTRQMEDGGYQFTRDLRLKMPSLLKVSHEVNRVFLKEIQCPTLVVMAENTAIPTTFMRELLESVDRDKVKFVRIPGGHHIHLCTPEVISSLVDSFLLTKTIPARYHGQELRNL